MIPDTLSHFDGDIPDTRHLLHSFSRLKLDICSCHNLCKFRFAYAAIVPVTINDVIDAYNTYVLILISRSVIRCFDFIVCIIRIARRYTDCDILHRHATHHCDKLRNSGISDRRQPLTG